MRRTEPVSDETLDLPLLPVRDTVLFPRSVHPLIVGRERSLRAIEEAMLRDRTIAVFTQKNPQATDVTFDELYDVGTEAVIGRMLKMPDGTTSVLVQGQRRIRLLDFIQSAAGA